ncbi:uncharacterized protein LOC122260646 [Penaeus japonicus]|uniref:uncharacterized protein LOC122260646 n=1 Tax=Penaeus japonicus TaxID=27405 RepID=UPI001C70D0A6|nr:uncharacterized protein LOC122260646 [Penaeus japonicus]
MSLRRILLLPLVVTYGATISLHTTPLPGTPVHATPLPDTPLPGTSDVPGYFLNMLMWSGKESERYHGNSLFPVAQSAISLPFTSTVCPSPFFPVMSQCFYTSTHHKLSWEDARTFCQQMGGDLAEPIHVNALMVYLRDHYRKNGFFSVYVCVGSTH